MKTHTHTLHSVTDLFEGMLELQHFCVSRVNVCVVLFTSAEEREKHTVFANVFSVIVFSASSYPRGPPLQLLWSKCKNYGSSN